MTLNAAAQLQHAFDRQERKKERAARSARGGAGFGAAAQSQNGSAPPRSAERKPAPPPVLDPEARRELVEQASGKSSREVMQLLAEVDPELAAPADRVRPLGGGRWELKAVIDDECRRGLERLKGLLSHVDPHLTMGQLLGRLVREGLDRHDPARPPRGRRAAPAKGAEQLRRRRRRRPRLAARTAPLLRRRRYRLRRRRSRETKPLTARTLRQRSRRATPLRRRRRGASAGRLRRRARRSPRRRRGPKLRQRRTAARPAAPSRRRSSARCGGATGAAAATWTAPAGTVAAPNTCCRSITSCRMPAVRRPSPLPPRRRRIRPSRRGSSGAGRPVIKIAEKRHLTLGLGLAAKRPVAYLLGKCARPSGAIAIGGSRMYVVIL